MNRFPPRGAGLAGGSWVRRTVFSCRGPALKSPAQYRARCCSSPALPTSSATLTFARGTLLPLIRRLQSGPTDFPQRCCCRHAQMRLITGAVLPVFNNPLKLAGQIGMVDAISNGRLEIGVARAFLPHEFGRFGISMDESRAQFDEGLEQIRLLLTQENVTCRGRFHSFENVTSQPRPTQTPRPPFWIAALSTKESFENAGRLGHYLMGIPLGGAQMAELIRVYRDAWGATGHPGRGRVMLAFSYVLR